MKHINFFHVGIIVITNDGANDVELTSKLMPRQRYHRYYERC